MQTLTLSENEITTLRGALEIAREAYLKNSAELRAMKLIGGADYERLAQQFERQAADAARLLETLDE